MGLADRLRLARAHEGLSVAKLAAAAGVSHYLIVRMEAGRGGGAALYGVHAIAEALRVAPGWLAFGDAQSRPEWLRRRERDERRKSRGAVII